MIHIPFIYRPGYQNLIFRDISDHFFCNIPPPLFRFLDDSVSTPHEGGVMVGFPDDDPRLGRQYGGDRDESSTVTGRPIN